MISTQKAGEGSTQIVIHGDYIGGLSESAVLEILDHRTKEIIAQFAQISSDLIAERLRNFDPLVASRLIKNGSVSSLQEPITQRLINEARKAAAYTDEIPDLEMLVDLIAEHCSDNLDRRKTSSLELAIRAVPLLTREALDGLVAWANTRPRFQYSSNLADILQQIDGKLAPFVAQGLPQDAEWIEELDLHKIVNINRASVKKSMSNIYSELLVGFLAPGSPVHLIPPLDSPEYGDYFVPSSLNPNVFRFLLPNESFQLDLDRAESEDFEETLIQHAKDHYGFGQIDPDLVNEFELLVKDYPNISAFWDWWDAHPDVFEFTPAGVYLFAAHTKNLSFGT